MKQEFVDLGLPSGILWSKRNVKLANKKHFTHYEIPLIEYITGYNVPSKEDFEELIKLCKWEWKTIGRTIGYKVTGPNGKSIFLSPAGYHYSTSLLCVGYFGYYWSTTYYGSSNACGLRFGSSSSNSAYFLRIHNSSKIVSYDYRDCSLSIRLIKRKRI